MEVMVPMQVVMVEADEVRVDFLLMGMLLIKQQEKILMGEDQVEILVLAEMGLLLPSPLQPLVDLGAVVVVERALMREMVDSEVVEGEEQQMAAMANLEEEVVVHLSMEGAALALEAEVEMPLK